MTFIARYWKVLAIAAAVGLVLAFISGALSRAERRGYERARADYATQLAEANARQAQRDAQARKAFQAKESRWIGERHALQNHITELAGRVSVRVCKPVADRRELPGAAPAAGSAGRAGEPRFDAMSTGPDIGAALVVFAGECESLRQRIIELKGRWPE